MKNVYMIILAILTGWGSSLNAQPQYYNYNTNGSNNSFPFGIAAGKDVQLLFLPGSFNQPSPAPPGNITGISFRIADMYPINSWTYNGLTVKMGQSAITAFTAGGFYGPLTTVYFSSSVVLTASGGSWLTITLDNQFPYDPAQSLIVEVGHCGSTGATGFPSCYTAGTSYSRIWSVAGCPFVYSSLNNSVYHMGISLCLPPVPTISGTNNLCVNTGNYTYSTEPGMTNYLWDISEGGTIMGGSGTSQIGVSWISPGDQSVTVNYTNTCGLQAPSPTTMMVAVNDFPAAAGPVTGTASLCAGTTGVAYSVVPIPGAISYIWNLPPGANIVSGQWTHAITVDFAEDASSGPIQAMGNNLCGNGQPSPDFGVTVNPIPPTPTVTVNEYLLISDAYVGNQWYHDGTAIPGANGQTYNVPPYLPGWYWTIVTLSGCSSEPSNQVLIQGVGVDESYLGPALRIFPDPASATITVETYIRGFLSILNCNGQKQLQQKITEPRTVLDISALPAGIYMLKAYSDKDVQVRKFIKN